MGAVSNRRSNSSTKPSADLGQVVHPVVVTPAVGGGGVQHRLQRDVGHRPHEIDRRRATRAQRREHPLALAQVAAPAHGDHGHRRPLQLRRERLLRRRRDQRDEDRQLFRRSVHQLAARAEGVTGLRPRVDQHPGEHRRADRVRAELEARDHPEVTAAAAQRPEQVLVLAGARSHHAPVGQHHLGRPQRIDRQAVMAHQPAHAPAEGEAADAGVRDLPGRHGEAVLLRRGVQLSQQRAAAGPDDPALGVDVDRVQPPQVDAERAVAHRPARHRVAAGADGELERAGTGGPDRRRHVLGVAGERDGRGATVDRSVPARACGRRSPDRPARPGGR